MSGPPANWVMRLYFKPLRGVHGLSTVLCTQEGVNVLSLRRPSSPKKNGSKVGLVGSMTPPRAADRPSMFTMR